MSTAPLVQITLRIETAVSHALARQAAGAHQETADYAADLLAGAVMGTLEQDDPDEARRLQAELEVKTRAIAIARDLLRGGFDPNVTLKVFKRIKADETLRDLYERAIGKRPGNDRRNPIKARINRNLGSTIKTAVGAVPHTVDGNVVKVQVTDEFILSYTQLAPGPGRKE